MISTIRTIRHNRAAAWRRALEGVDWFETQEDEELFIECMVDSYFEWLAENAAWLHGRREFRKGLARDGWADGVLYALTVMSEVPEGRRPHPVCSHKPDDFWEPCRKAYVMAFAETVLLVQWGRAAGEWGELPEMPWASRFL